MENVDKTYKIASTPPLENSEFFWIQGKILLTVEFKKVEAIKNQKC